MISFLKTILSSDKLDRILALLDHVDYDPTTKTLTVDSDITIRVRGNYKMDTDKHVFINSNYLEKDDTLNIPYSVFLNSDEAEFKNVQNQVNSILSE